MGGVTAGTFVPARMPGRVLREVTVQAHLNAARWHTEQANRLTGGKQYRVTSERPTPAWHCADCQMTVAAGDRCACGHGGEL